MLALCNLLPVSLFDKSRPFAGGRGIRLHVSRSDGDLEDPLELGECGRAAHAVST